MKNALLLAVCCCAGAPAIVPGVVFEADAGPPADAGRDAGAPEDGGEAVWCAAENGSCLANGGEYDVPGHCCVGRMSCFKAAGASSGRCAYTNWCADESAPCLADGWQGDVPGHCCNDRMTCGAAGCAY